jgi:hypothetical protein
MKTTITLGLGALAVLTLAAFHEGAAPARRAAPADSSSFLAELHGDVHASPRGNASFGTVEGFDGAAEVFTLTIGTQESSGSVLFTRAQGGPPVPGTYSITDRGDGSDEVRVLVLTGTATKPTGVFQGQSGHLIITSANEDVIQGRFTVEARGFLASDPDDEGRPMQATGMFTATRRAGR